MLCIPGAGYNTRKIIVKTAFGLCLLSAFLFLCVPVICYAFQQEELVKIISDAMSGIEGLMDSAQEATSIMFFNIHFITGQQYMGTMAMLTVSGVAGTVYSIYVIISIIKEAVYGNATIDMFLKTFLRMAVVLFLLLNLNALTNAIHGGMAAIAKKVVGALSDASKENYENISEQIVANIRTAVKSSLSEDVTSATLSVVLAQSATRLFVSIPVFFGNMLISVSSYMLVIELYIRKIFLPLGMLSFLGDSAKAGFRQIKRYIGVYIKMILYIACLVIAQMLVIADVYVKYGSFGVNVLTATGIYAPIYQAATYAIGVVILLFAATVFATQAEGLASELLNDS